MQKVLTASDNMGQKNLEKLRSIFPQFVKDGEVDFDALKQWFDSEGVLAGDERYGLNWAGKSNAFKAIRIPATGTLVPSTSAKATADKQDKESKDWDKTENIFIEGDNLEVLKLLQKHYREQIKMIYIDPPYNTGKDFIYKDNFTEIASDYYERTGQSKDGVKLTSNLESNGRFHSDWLTMMYPRLFLALNLLKQDGVIFVSIDDNEVANLRMIMDEIFGEENFVASVIWERKFSPQNDAKWFSDNHDYVLIYAKYKEIWRPNKLLRTDQNNSRFQNPDNDPRGIWASSDMTVKTYNANYYYPITTPSGKEIFPTKGRCWSVPKGKFKELIGQNRVWFGQKGGSVPRYKTFLSELEDGIVPITIWKHSVVGHNQEARQELKELFNGEGYFDGPKPVRLLKYILGLSTKENDLVLDFFAGSGTTAHAVMDLNAEDSGNRKWICVQLPEVTEEDSEAFNAGYKTIAEISRERIRRAGKKIGKGDVEFKSFELSKSNYRQWNVLTDKDSEDTLKDQMKLFIEKPLVEKHDERSVVYEILVKEGFGLNAKVEPTAAASFAKATAAKKAKAGDAGIHVWSVVDGERRMVVTFAKKVGLGQVEALGLGENDTFVCLDSALDDTTKVNLVRNFKVKVI